MIPFYFLQGSDEWLLAHKGVPTASRFDRILTPKTLKPSAQAEDYIDELVGDRLTSDEEFLERNRPMTAAMKNGHACEPEARRFYEMERSVDVQQVGFCLSDCGRFGCSPDGLVGAEGGLELKCPQPKAQVRYLRAGGLPGEYKCQVHGCLIVTGRPWWDFLSYCPGCPPLLVRVVPDEFTLALSAALVEFLVRLEAAWESVKPREV